MSSVQCVLVLTLVSVSEVRGDRAASAALELLERIERECVLTRKP